MRASSQATSASWTLLVLRSCATKPLLSSAFSTQEIGADSVVLNGTTVFASATHVPVSSWWHGRQTTTEQVGTAGCEW